TQDAWEDREETPDGAFLVRYAPEPAGDAAPATFVKTRIRYLPPPRKARPGGALLTPALRPEGSSRATFDPRAGHLLSLSSEEGLTVLVGGRVVARRHTSVELELVRAETVPADALAEMQRAWTARERVPAVSLSWREPIAAHQAAAY